MDKSIAIENIKRFCDLLSTEKDQAARQKVLELLSKEKDKLAMAVAKEAGDDWSSGVKVEC